MGIKINRIQKPAKAHVMSGKTPRHQPTACPTVSLKPRLKPPKAKPPLTPQSSVTVSASVPQHIEERLRAFADRENCTIGSAIALALHLFLPLLEAE